MTAMRNPDCNCVICLDHRVLMPCLSCDRTNSLQLENIANGKTTALHRRRPQEAAHGRRKAGQGRRHHPRADRPQCHHRQVLRRPDRHQGRRHRQQGNRSARSVREHGRQARQRGRPEDQRHRRRRHHHRHRAGPGHLPGRPRNITAGANPMAVKRGIDKAVDAAVEHLEELSKQAVQEGRNEAGRHASAPTTTRSSAS